MPQYLIPILVTLALSFLIGLQREESHAVEGSYNFGGVRTFPIIGLSGYLLAQISSASPLVISIGLLVMGALLWLSYQKKLKVSTNAGLTSEASGLFTFLMGMVVQQGELWEATTLAVIVLLLLELKVALERLAHKIPPTEIFTFTRFLLLSAVILPIVPNQNYSEFQINPYHVWIVVIVISGLSYASYGIGRIIGSTRGLLLTAVMGGIYSSTATTVMLAKKSTKDNRPHLYSGAVLTATGSMYYRLIILLFIFNAELARILLLPFLILGTAASGFGWYWSRKNLSAEGHTSHARHKFSDANPLELKTAFKFTVLFVGMGILTKIILQYFGDRGVFVMSFLTGLTDINPFVMSIAKMATPTFTPHNAAICIAIAAASNNIIVGTYAMLLTKGPVRKMSFLLMGALALLGFALAFFI